MGKIKDIKGQKFGKLSVIEYKGIKDNRATWLCKCDCGNIITTFSKELLSQKKKSCGCIHKEQLIQRNKTHNLSKSKLYKRWIIIKNRCYNKNSKDYKYYGGRGIKVCDEWKNDFISFYNWAIQNGYYEHLEKYGNVDTTIDRINVNGDYEPSNCKWSTQKEQANNKRKNIIIV